SEEKLSEVESEAYMLIHQQGDHVQQNQVPTQGMTGSAPWGVSSGFSPGRRFHTPALSSSTSTGPWSTLYVLGLKLGTVRSRKGPFPLWRLISLRSLGAMESSSPEMWQKPRA